MQTDLISLSRKVTVQTSCTYSYCISLHHVKIDIAECHGNLFSPYTIHTPNRSLGAWPRRWQIPAVGLVGWTAEIELSSPILQKDPQNFHEIKPTVHPSLRKFCEESPQIFLKPTRSPPTRPATFSKDPLYFLKINPPSFLSLRNFL